MTFLSVFTILMLILYFHSHLKMTSERSKHRDLNKKKHLSALLSYLSTQEFFLETCTEKHKVRLSASRTSQVQFKIPSAYITRQCTRMTFLISFIKCLGNS